MCRPFFLSALKFTPQHGRWRQQVASLITAAQRNRERRSLLLERSNIFNNGIQGNCCNIVIRGHYCEQTITSVPVIASVCFISDLCSHCCNSVLQQWPLFLLLKQYVATMASVSLLHQRVPTVTLGRPGCVFCHSCTYVIAYRSCILGHSWVNVIRNLCCASMSFNNVFW
jgi:hypothetical protein